MNQLPGSFDAAGVDRSSPQDYGTGSVAGARSSQIGFTEVFHEDAISHCGRARLMVHTVAGMNGGKEVISGGRERHGTVIKG